MIAVYYIDSSNISLKFIHFVKQPVSIREGKLQIKIVPRIENAVHECKIQFQYKTELKK